MSVMAMLRQSFPEIGRTSFMKPLRRLTFVEFRLTRHLEFADAQTAYQFHHWAVEPERRPRPPRRIREARARFPRVDVSPLREEPVAMLPDRTDRYNGFVSARNFPASVHVISKACRFRPNRRELLKVPHLVGILHRRNERALVQPLVGIRHQAVERAPTLIAEAFRVSIQPLCE